MSRYRGNQFYQFQKAPMPTPEKDPISWLTKFMRTVEANFRNLEQTIVSLKRVTESLQTERVILEYSSSALPGAVINFQGGSIVLGVNTAASTATGLLMMKPTDQPLTKETDFYEYITRGTVTSTAHGFTLGDPLYLDNNGGFTATAPVAAGSVTRVIGHAISTNEIFFDPSNYWVVN